MPAMMIAARGGAGREAVPLARVKCALKIGLRSVWPRII
jgi:hypothetical protein